MNYTPRLKVILKEVNLSIPSFIMCKTVSILGLDKGYTEIIALYLRKAQWNSRRQRAVFDSISFLIMEY